jgi:tetratricopeptide (TPR) repeat protein
MARQMIRGFVTGACVLLVLTWAAPASAQNGALKGKVVNEDGKPVDSAEVILDFVGQLKRQLKTITDKNGEWIKPGIPAGGGTWTISAKKNDLTGSTDKIEVKINETVKVPDITIMSAASRAKGVKPTVSSEEAAAITKKAAETDKLLEETNAAISSGNLDEAITKLKTLIERLATERNDQCQACHAKLGDIYLANKDVKAAEASYLKAIEVDATKPGPYNALAAMYNEQRRFEDATKMSAKAAELSGAAGSSDPSALYNQGIIFWNQSKAAEAKVQFAKAIELDPKMADAHYYLGMANLNLGVMADAKKNFQEYLKLAPTGANAETAKAILAQIK